MTYYWKMRNGQLIDIDQMSEHHLRNTLKMIVRNSQQKPNVVKSRLGNIEENFFEELYKEYEENEYETF